MSILNEITIDFDLDCKVLCDTPAKLKLRNKTLSGINYNLDNIDNIPGLMLAKKKKKPLDGIKLEKKDKKKKEDKPVIETEEVVNEELPVEEVKEENASVLTSEITPVEPVLETTYEEEGRKLRLSEDKFKAFEENTAEIVRELLNEMIAATNDEVVVEEVQVDEIPVAIEEPEFTIEQGEIGEVADVNVVEVQEEQPVIETEEAVAENNEPVEEKKVPSLDEVREKMLIDEPQKEVVIEETTAMDKANNDDVFAESTKLNDEVREIRLRVKSGKEILDSTRSKYEDVSNLNNELNTTYQQTKEEADLAEKSFHDAIKAQKDLLVKMKESLQEQDAINNKEVEELNAKTATLEEENAKRSEEIQKESERLTKYRSLLASLQSMEFENQDEEEMSYARVA